MKCIRCGSRRIIEFVDSFGGERVFCRDCFISLERTFFIRLSAQKNLQEVYFKNLIKTWNMKQ